MFIRHHVPQSGKSSTPPTPIKGADLGIMHTLAKARFWEQLVLIIPVTLSKNKNKTTKKDSDIWDGCEAQVVDCLPSKHQALIPNPVQKKKKKKKERKKTIFWHGSTCSTCLYSQILGRLR
jgi:hypothetical protein